MPSALAFDSQVRERCIVPVPAPQGLQNAGLDHLVHAPGEDEEHLAGGTGQVLVAPPTRAVRLALRDHAAAHDAQTGGVDERALDEPVLSGATVVVFAPGHGVRLPPVAAVG
eukprot:6990728-Alexandrium_andersonii.AAC.1